MPVNDHHENFLTLNGTIYLNTASCGLLDENNLQETRQFYQDMLTESSTASETARDQRLPQIRNTVAGFLDVSADHIAFVPNFSWAINGLVQALRGDEKVLLYRDDYPSLYEPFRINGFDITWIDARDGFSLDTAAIQAALLTYNIRVLALSHVQWLTGFMADIAALGAFCRQHDIIFIVDATQSLGAMPIYPEQVQADVLIASNYKWMNAGFGTGVMYLSDRFMTSYPPVTGGHNSYAMIADNWQYTASVRSYEPGHLNLHGLMILEAAIRQKMAMGLEHIAAHNAALTHQFLQGLDAGRYEWTGPAHMDGRSSIVVLKAGKDLHQHLAHKGIVVTWRNGMIRVSFHFYNTEAQVNTLLQCLNDR